MKLINQSFDIITQTKFDIVSIYKQIERCARLAYKSEDKITEDSYKRMAEMLEEKGHDRPLEFGTVHLKVPEGVWHDMVLTLATDYNYSTNWVQAVLHFGEYYITTNYRYYVELLGIFPEISQFFTEEDDKLFPIRPAVHFVLSRGIMDEFRTHVGFSHIAESTRWVNYSRDKFGNEVTFIIPNWVNTHCPNKEQKGPSVADEEWSVAMKFAEKYYFSLLAKGWKPQQAREVLPLSVKSELISCGFKDCWSNFFNRRCAKDAHPMAREIAIPLQEEFKKLGYIK